MPPKEMKNIRLEVEGIFGAGSHLDEVHRFEIDLATKGGYLLVCVLIGVAIVLGLCGVRLHSCWKNFKKLKKQKANKKTDL